MQSYTKEMFPDQNQLRTAYQRIQKRITHTPLFTCSTLNKLWGMDLFFKCENFQKSGSFKFRGASNAIAKLTPGQAAKGVCTHSSGNHAQALALAAQNQGIKAFIVMPENAPLVKVNAVKQYGGQITFCQPTLEAREKNLQIVQQKTGATFIHPYNNYDVIEGQASCALEIFEELPYAPDYIITPLGGGGLLSGTLLSTQYFSPETRVLGAEPQMANDAWQSLQHKKFIPSRNPQTIADGLKTSLGSITFPLIMDMVEDILLAPEQTIKETMYLVWERMKIVIEPSAAVPLAALRENKNRFSQKKIAVVFSGGNIDLQKIPWISNS